MRAKRATAANRMGPPAEHETRQRLIDVAGQLFAEHGFERVTVRQICRAAGANVAAVNYHFGDKLGLYTAVVREAIDTIGRRRASLKAATAGQPAVERLRRYIGAYIERILTPQPTAWIHRLLAREMAEPTAALDLIVDDAIRPQLADLGDVVSALLGCGPDDPRVRPIVLSIQGQCLMYVPTPVSMRIGRRHGPATPAQVEAIARHVAEFSLGGIRAVR